MNTCEHCGCKIWERRSARKTPTKYCSNTCASLARYHRTKILTPRDETQKLLREKNERLKGICNINRLIIMHNLSTGDKTLKYLTEKCIAPSTTMTDYTHALKNLGLIKVTSDNPKTYGITDHGKLLYMELRTYMLQLLNENESQ